MSRDLTKVYFTCNIIYISISKKRRNMLKKTKTRELVKNTLENANKPLSAYEIFDKLKDNNITLSSIYRTLEIFHANNIISKDIGNDKVCKYTIIKNEHKHYLECRKCHTSTALDFCPYHTANKKIKNETNFTVDEHNVIILGVCENCNKKQTNKK